MRIFERAIQIALQYLGKTDSNHDAPYLRELAADGGNPSGWLPGEPECISMASACFGVAYKERGTPFPIKGSASVMTFYHNALAAGLVHDTPSVGDIFIMQLGDTIHGHAGIVTDVLPAAIRTIEFDTSPINSGDQHLGEGCFPKYRAFESFQKSQTKLWFRGYVTMPEPGENAASAQVIPPEAPEAEPPAPVETEDTSVSIAEPPQPDFNQSISQA